ncbi:hypothetical protein ACFLWV_00870 [Chloroflexota bacterium]
MECDDLGRVWIATDGNGLTMFDGQEWHNWHGGSAIRGLAISGNTVYAGACSSACNGGVMIYEVEQDQWINLLPDTSELSSGGVQGIAVDSSGKAYFPTCMGFLDIYDDGNWVHIWTDPLPWWSLLSANDALFDNDGNYWVATNMNGVWKYDGVTWSKYGGVPLDEMDEKFKTPDGGDILNGSRVISFPRNDHVADGIPSWARALALDHEGQLWVAGVGGLAVRHLDDTWSAYPSDQFPLETWLEDIAVDATGRIWVLSGKLLTVIDGDNWQSFTPDVVGMDFWGDAIAFDKEGRAWIAAQYGRKIAIFKEEP